MSAASSMAAQQKFTNLRKRLDQLGYRQPLGIESLPLVERLFSDLIHTTESLKKNKLQSVKGSKEQITFEAQIEPYKSDNAKLVKENNDLHQHLIKVTEDSEANIKDLKASLRKIEHENADLKFLNNQYVHKIRQLEKESKQKTDKILQLQEKNLHAVVQTPGGRRKTIAFRRQRMELDSTVPDRSEVPFISTTAGATEDPYVADLLRIADNNIAQLKADVELFREEKEALQGKISHFRKQVENRDTEIDRLTRLLEGGRPYDVVALESRNRSNERLISHLNIQIDYLQQKNQDLQNQLDTAVDTARLSATEKTQIDSWNKNLSAELQDVDYMAKQLQVEKDSVIRAADREIVEAKIDLEKSRSELETMDFEVAQLRTEKERLAAECTDLKMQLNSEKTDRQRLDELVSKVQEDKKRLSHRVNKLTSNEKELVLEMDRLKHRNGMVKKRSKSPNRLDQFIRGLEEERDYWKGEVEVLQKLMRGRASSPTRSRSRNVTPIKTKSRTSSPSNTAKSDLRNSGQFQAMLHVLEEERDHYKRECELLKAIRSRPTSPTRSSSRSSRLGDDDTELGRVIREREELQSLLDKFERHMSEIQANVKVLTSERDKLNNMYDETKEELTRLRREVVRSPKSPKTSLAAQAVLRRVENERDDAITDLRRLTMERDTLRERLKIATDTQLADHARSEQKLEDLEVALRTVEAERDTLDDRVKGLQRLSDNLEHQLKDQAMQLATARDDAAQNKATATQMRLLAEQTERSLQDNQSRLSHKDADLGASKDHVCQLETRISDVQHAARTDQDDIRRLRSTIAALDHEKDNLQIGVDEKTERVVTMEEDLAAKEYMIKELRLALTEMEANLHRTRESVVAKDREITSLRRQLDSTSEELTEVGRGREVALRENRRLQDDLSTMTRENQNISQELADIIEEKETLKSQVQDYIVEVKRVEEHLSSKEQERSDLLEQYRNLTLEAERYETQTHQLESEGSNMRLELMTRDSEIRRLREKIDTMERQIQQHLHTESAYDNQVSGLTRSVASLEDSLKTSDAEKQSILMDLQAVRDLCARLEATKDDLQRQITTKALDKERLQTIVDDMKYETDTLRAQVSSERTSVKNLEDLLQTNREKEFVGQLTTQEKDTELQLMRDRIALNESKIDSQGRELITLRGRSIELESELERTRRLLTSERFDRERAVQELRRHGLTPPSESRLSRAGATSPLNRSRSPGRRSPFTRSFLDIDDPLTTNNTM